jgi:hypothetical protein
MLLIFPVPKEPRPQSEGEGSEDAVRWGPGGHSPSGFGGEAGGLVQPQGRRVPPGEGSWVLKGDASYEAS